MKVTIKLFAILKDRAGAGELSLELPIGATAGYAAETLARKYPDLAKYLPSSGYAVNREYVPPTSLLHDGDELALIPPVSGG
jgi:molybdopterin converting factor small subunit